MRFSKTSIRGVRVGDGYSVLTVFDYALGWVAIGCVRLYQIFVCRFINRTCLFSPSCSRYAIQVLRRYGFSTGWALIRRRLSICNGDYSMRINATGAVELVTSCGRIIRQRGINPAIASRIASFVLTTGGNKG
jgi:putative component of membrane protein insertase Oxa1/YidC/SpoIIIJ protein YidD